MAVGSTRQESSMPKYVILGGRREARGKKKGPLVAWSDLLVIVSSRCWHYDSSGLPDWLKRAHELPHTVIVLRLSTRCLRIRN